MSLHWGDYREPPAFRPEPLVCPPCRSDELLEITAIDDLPGNPDSLVLVSYRCNGCGMPRTQPADVTAVARILNRQGNTADVLAFGDHYIHCGQPMTGAGAEMRRIHSTYREKNLPEALSVYLATRVLHCRCGFQMEIPYQSPDENLDPDTGVDGTPRHHP